MAPEPPRPGDPRGRSPDPWVRGPGPRLKDLGVAYALCVLLGLLGAHRFYLGHLGTGLAYAVLTVTGLAGASWGIGFLLGALVILLVLVDLVRLPGLVRRANGGT